MTDATIIKPRPGLRTGKNKAAFRPQVSSDATVVATPTTNKTTLMPLPMLGSNPLLESASTILSMVNQVRCTPTHADTKVLKQAFNDRLNEYEASLRYAQINQASLDAAMFCLCCLIDETVLNTQWGGESEWGQESLLSMLHSQTSGGEYFFTLLDDHLCAPFQHAQLLELQYVCLSLGFVGKYKFEQVGQQKLEEYRQHVFSSLEQVNGEIEEGLAIQTYPVVEIKNEGEIGIPTWLVMSVFGALLLSLFLFSRYTINQHSDPVFNQIQSLAQWTPAQETVSLIDEAELLLLQQRLNTEVERGLIRVEPMRDRVRFTIASHELFAPGSADIKASFIPILQKLSRALESTDGRILITGHTDSQPIITSRFPSNWHLSLARATAVADTMSVGTLLRGRLWPEGRGESEPVQGNLTQSERAQNRRVEIDLLN